MGPDLYFYFHDAIWREPVFTLSNLCIRWPCHSSCLLCVGAEGLCPCDVPLDAEGLCSQDTVCLEAEGPCPSKAISGC